MKKAIIAVLLVVLTFNLSIITLTPEVSAKTDDVQVLSYSWYNIPGYDLTTGDFIIVGEVQNYGTKIIEDVVVQCIVTAADGHPHADGGNTAFVKYLNPGQKAPFYIDITAEQSYSGEMAWTALVEHVSVFVTSANETEIQQYQGLAVTGSSPEIIDGVYTVSGYIRNEGDQDPGPFRMVTTFYNESGTVVAVNVTDVLSNSLIPGQICPFRATPADKTRIASNITDFGLLIQTDKTTANITPSPSSQSPNPSSTNLPTNSAQPTQSTGPEQNSIPIDLIYFAFAAIIIVLVIVVLMLLRKPRQLPKPLQEAAPI